MHPIIITMISLLSGVFFCEPLRAENSPKEKLFDEAYYERFGCNHEKSDSYRKKVSEKYNLIKNKYICKEGKIENLTGETYDVLLKNPIDKSAFIMLIEKCFFLDEQVSIFPMKIEVLGKNKKIKMRLSYWDEEIESIIDGFTSFCFTKRDFWPCK